MKVIIAGSRQITDYQALCEAIHETGWTLTEVVSGGARGVDSLGQRWAADRAIPLTIFPADWEKYGKSAGYRRNAEMANYADALLLLWDGSSRGSGHMLNIARERQLLIFEQRYPRHRHLLKDRNPEIPL